MPDSAEPADHRIAYDHRLAARLWPYIRPYRRHMLLALFLLPLAAAVQLLPPYILKLIIDGAIVPRHFDRLGPLLALLGGAYLAQQLLVFGHLWLLQLCGQRAMHDLRTATHRHILSLSTAFFDRTPVGKLMTRITNDVESIAEAFASGVVAALGDILRLVGIVVAMLLLNARLALLTLAVLPLLLVVVGIFQRLLRQAHRRIRRRLARINATLQEQLTGVKIVQIFGKERQSREQFDEVNGAFRDAYKSAIRFDAALFSLVELVSSLTIALLLWYGGIRLAAGTVTFGLLVAFVEYVQRFFEPIRDISTKYATMQQAMAASERVFELLDLADPDAPSQHATAAHRPHSLTQGFPKGIVEFRRVDFGYGHGNPLFSNLSFLVARGSQVAIVGATGAGKSSIARLLIRLYETSGGQILLEGQDIRHMAIDELRRRVVVLSQDVFLFAGTVRDNISLAEPSISDRAIAEAADQVGLTDLVSLDRRITERGGDLSAGERQLIVFARALVRDPEILVLDEATASVDPESERLVQQGTEAILRRRTAIVIAHRLTTIERAERVLVLHQGRIIEQGRHDELVALGGTYSRLYELQYVQRPGS